MKQNQYESVGNWNGLDACVYVFVITRANCVFALLDWNLWLCHQNFSILDSRIPWRAVLPIWVPPATPAHCWHYVFWLCCPCRFVSNRPFSIAIPYAALRSRTFAVMDIPRILWHLDLQLLLVWMILDVWLVVEMVDQVLDFDWLVASIASYMNNITSMCWPIRLNRLHYMIRTMLYGLMSFWFDPITGHSLAAGCAIFWCIGHSGGGVPDFMSNLLWSGTKPAWFVACVIPAATASAADTVFPIYEKRIAKEKKWNGINNNPNGIGNEHTVKQ